MSPGWVTVGVAFKTQSEDYHPNNSLRGSATKDEVESFTPSWGLPNPNIGAHHQRVCYFKWIVHFGEFQALLLSGECGQVSVLHHASFFTRCNNQTLVVITGVIFSLTVCWTVLQIPQTWQLRNRIFANQHSSNGRSQRRFGYLYRCLPPPPSMQSSQISLFQI